MKNFFITLLLITGTQIALAQIENSQNEKRHQDLIVTAASTACGISTSLVKQISQTVENVKVDQNVTDFLFTTKLELRQKIDQNIFDTYQVEIVTKYYDLYDHNSHERGVYTVESIGNCKIQE